LFSLAIGGGTSFIELQELDHFIEAADAIRAAQTFAIDTSPHAVPKLGQLTDMITMGEVLRRIDTPTMGGELMMFLQLKRDRATLHEYVVLGTIALGWWLILSFRIG
jgi:hypothetical protein